MSARFGNPLAPTTPATLGWARNWACFVGDDAEFATGMGTTLVRGMRAHLRRDALRPA